MRFHLPYTPDGAIDVAQLARVAAPPIETALELTQLVSDLSTPRMPAEGRPIAAALAMLGTLNLIARRTGMAPAELETALGEALRKTTYQPRAFHDIDAPYGAEVVTADGRRIALAPGDIMRLRVEPR